MTEEFDSLDVSRETLAELEHYKNLLLKWNPKINLVSKSSIDDVWNRHIWDSAQIFDLGGTAKSWADFGSGGGFPGLVVAILAKQRVPDRHVTLIESDVRKCAFLRTVAQELSLSVTVVAKRIEQIDPIKADVISARALADLTALLGYCERHLAADGRAIFLKGASWEKEVSDAGSQWSFDLRVHKSITNADAAVLELKEIARV